VVSIVRAHHSDPVIAAGPDGVLTPKGSDGIRAKYIVDDGAAAPGGASPHSLSPIHLLAQLLLEDLAARIAG
jgi:hypothetical protein